MKFLFSTELVSAVLADVEINSQFEVIVVTTASRAAREGREHRWPIFSFVGIDSL